MANLIPTWPDRFKKRVKELLSSTRQRHKRKKIPPPPFDANQLGAHLLKYLGSHDGVVFCRYCRRICDVTNLAMDHEIPIMRGGSLGLDNIGFPCQPCNLEKGGLTPDEFLRWREFKKTLHPTAEADLTQRLVIAVQLAGAANWGRKKAAKAAKVGTNV